MCHEIEVILFKLNISEVYMKLVIFVMDVMKAIKEEVENLWCIGLVHCT